MLTPRESLAESAGTSAQIRYRQASEAFRQQKWDEARRLLLGLWSEGHTYDVALTLVQVEYQLGHYAAAANYLTFVLDNVPPAEKLSAVSEYKKNLADLQARTARLKVTAGEANVDVAIDGQSAGKSPLDVYVEPGHHALSAVIGGQNATRDLDVGAGSTTPVELKVESPPPAMATSAAPLPAPSSTQEPATSASPKSTSGGKSMTPVWIGSGVTVLGLATWVGFGLAASTNDADKYKKQLAGSACTTGAASASDCAAARDAYDSQRRNATLSEVGLGVTVVGGLATLGYLLLWPDDDKPASGLAARPGFAFDRSGGTISASGSF